MVRPLSGARSSGVEHLTFNQRVTGSIPVGLTMALGTVVGAFAALHKITQDTVMPGIVRGSIAFRRCTPSRLCRLCTCVAARRRPRGPIEVRTLLGSLFTRDLIISCIAVGAEAVHAQASIRVGDLMADERGAIRFRPSAGPLSGFKRYVVNERSISAPCRRGWRRCRPTSPGPDRPGLSRQPASRQYSPDAVRPGER